MQKPEPIPSDIQFRRELIGSYLDALIEAVSFTHSEIIPILNSQLELSTFEDSLLGLFLRIHSLASSVTRLNNSIDYNSVTIIARTVFELLLDMHLLSVPGRIENAKEKFYNFAEVDRYKKAIKVMHFQAENPDLIKESFFDASVRNKFARTPGRKEEIEGKIEKLWGRDKRGKVRYPEHWSGKTIRQRATIIGKKYEQDYLEIYNIMSNYAHSGNASYVNLTKEALEALYGIAVKIVNKKYLEAILLIAEPFKLGQAVRNFQETMEILDTVHIDIMKQFSSKESQEKLDLYNNAILPSADRAGKF